MKKTAFVFLILLTALPAFAQKNLFGIRAGYSRNNTWPSFMMYQREPRHGFTVGFSYERLICQKLTAGADLLYQQRGFIMPFPYAPKHMIYIPWYFNFDYIALPLKIG